MATRKGLGRGLDVLMPESDRSPGITTISLNDIDTNPSQPRIKFDQEKLDLIPFYLFSLTNLKEINFGA